MTFLHHLSCFLLLSFVCCQVCQGFLVDFPQLRKQLRSNDRSLKMDPKVFSFVSPCKINLFLQVTGRRTDGYHNISSLFQAVSLSDQLYFSNSEVEEDSLYCSDPSLSVAQDNLILRALRLMRRNTGLNRYFKVHLEKNVPTQAGLGGGSANAATAMYAFNQLCGHPATEAELSKWSAELGADVPFFFSSGTAYCTGIGEVVRDLPSLPNSGEISVHLFKPQVGLATESVFRSLQVRSERKWSEESVLNDVLNYGIVPDSKLLFTNDLEDPAFSLYPLLGNIKQCILEALEDRNSGIIGCSMSGSGSTIFALSSSPHTNLRPEWVSKVLSSFPFVSYYRCELLRRSPNQWY